MNTSAGYCQTSIEEVNAVAEQIKNFLKQHLVKGIFRRLRYWFAVKAGPVYMYNDQLDDLPPFEAHEQYEIREMDHHNERDIDRWCTIMNQSFDRDYTREDGYAGAITDHPFYEVLHTYFLTDKDQPIGVDPLLWTPRKVSIMVVIEGGVHVREKTQKEVQPRIQT